MKGVFFAVFVSALVLCGADKKHRNSKGPDIEVLEASTRRSEGLVAIDSRVRNVGEKPIHGLTLVFEFFGAGHVPITTQKAAIDEDSLATGEESTIRAKLNDPVRAVTFEISAVDEPGHDLKVAKPGPYSIE